MPFEKGTGMLVWKRASRGRWGYLQKEKEASDRRGTQASRIRIVVSLIVTQHSGYGALGDFLLWLGRNPIVATGTPTHLQNS